MAVTQDLDAADLLTGQGCPHEPGMIFVNHITGEVRKGHCGVLTCPPAARAIATSTARAVQRAEPSHVVTLTQTGPTWPEVKPALNEFNRKQKRLAPRWASSSFVHRNPSGDGQTHLHMYARGEVDEDQITASATAVGFGPHVHIARLDGRFAGYAYALHPIFDTREMSTEEAADHVDAYLADNGGIIAHATRGPSQFWKDRHGRPSTLKEARKSTDSGVWVAERRPVRH